METIIVCDSNTLKIISNEVYKNIKNIFGVKLHSVILFGSYARGDCDKESDIDIMAIVDIDKSELIKYRRLVSKFTNCLDLKYDVLISVKLQDKSTFTAWQNTLPFFINVKKEGVVISE